MGKERTAWHQHWEAKVGAYGRQTISTGLLFSPLWRWARNGAGPSFPKSQHRSPTQWSSSQHQGGVVTGVMQECSPTSPCPDRVVHFQTHPPLQASLLTSNPSREGLGSSLSGCLGWAWQLLACSTPSFPHHPVEHTNHSQADTLLDPDHSSCWWGILKPSPSFYHWLFSMPASC